MVEVLVTGALVAGGVALVARRSHHVAVPTGADETVVYRIDGEAATDLPCPWCLAPTAEEDARCPSCRQRFG